MEVGPVVRSGVQQSAVAGRKQLLEQSLDVRQLAARDMEVRAHEQAHAAVGGVHAGAPVYEFTKGPNGVRYAVSGHVNIDVGEVPGDPAATLKKMETVARAALAPAQPSAADRAVAAKANAQAAQARAEMAAENGEQLAGIMEATVAAPAASANSAPGNAPAAGNIIDLIV